MNNRDNTPLARAIKKAGTANDLARLLGITPQAISQWTEIPIKRAPDVSRVTGIPLHELRPDIFDAPKPEGEGQ
jgi:DNA-binding transcriptional regulator YdaS (Cro superfamily)